MKRKTGKTSTNRLRTITPTPGVPSAKDVFRFNVISTFSGCGGSSLGYEWAGGKVLLAVENDDNAVRTYRTNFPGTPVYHGNIKDLGVADCCRLARVRPGELDILDGSPPCQGKRLLRATLLRGRTQSTVLPIHPSAAWPDAESLHRRGRKRTGTRGDAVAVRRFPGEHESERIPGEGSTPGRPVFWRSAKQAKDDFRRRTGRSGNRAESPEGAERTAKHQAGSRAPRDRRSQRTISTSPRGEVSTNRA